MESRGRIWRTGTAGRAGPESSAGCSKGSDPVVWGLPGLAQPAGVSQLGTVEPPQSPFPRTDLVNSEYEETAWAPFSSRTQRILAAFPEWPTKQSRTPEDEKPPLDLWCPGCVVKAKIIYPSVLLGALPPVEANTRSSMCPGWL